MLVAIPQINYNCGDVQGNTKKIISAVEQAQKQKANLVIFPELAISGAVPQDLLEQEKFISECRLAIENIALKSSNIAIIIGAPNLDLDNGIMYNSAYFIANGEVTDGVHKNILSDYDVVNESRYFIAGEDNNAIKYMGQNIRIIFDEYESEFIENSDSFVVNIGMQVFTKNNINDRKQTLANIAKRYNKNIISVNHLGAYTSLLFDGNSMVASYKGDVVKCLNEFVEDFQIIDTNKLGKMPALVTRKINKIDLLYRAIYFGVKEYFTKNGFTKAILGLSGGIDSAVVASIAVDVLGKDNVFGLLMPSEYSTDHSLSDAEALAINLGMKYQTVAIKDIYNQFMSSLAPLFEGQEFNVAEENLQARSRAVLVMAMSNKFGHIALNTTNKSEAAVGYGTLYGDCCGSISILGDVYKTEVYKLAKHINRERELIPLNTITKAPSAELRPGQVDQDSLPEYDKLDAIIKLYIEENLDAEKIIAQGHDKAMVEKVIRMINNNNYKRAQCPACIKLTKKAFGSGRRFHY